ncbi:MAG: TatD family hydrolase, partial [Lentisphaeria bacterium]|nr:TatD family hydrolase [Lentisphaeria bacterium]
MIADLHTHRFKGGAFELVSTGEPEKFLYSSLEVHPWKLPDHFEKFDSDFAARASNCSAIGEIGLDRLRGPELPVQRKYFDALLEIADVLSKPVVIHCVRCDAELFQQLAGFKHNVLIHGF